MTDSPNPFSPCCISCQDTLEASNGNEWPPNWRRVMIVCPVCGNKRCPKATHHDNECTNSNEPGQPGSVYDNFLPKGPQ